MSPSSSAEAVPGAVPAPDEHHEHHPSYLVDGTTVKSWLLTLDHKRIGVMYLIWVLLFFLIGGTYALVVRLELLTPGPTIIDAMTYNRAFTMHGVVMIFLFMIPAIPGAFGNFMLPLMLGAKDVAFPRLNLLSLYLLLIGAVIAIWGMINGGMDTGWTFYTPYSTHTTTTVAPILFGAFIIGFSSIATGLNFIVTTHTMRAPGITWFKMPLFVWAMYATACIQVLATPVLGLVLLLVVGEQLFHFGIFDPARGGDPVLFQHLFWFYSHPAVYIMVLPSFGVMSEIVAAFSRKNIFGYRAVAFSSLGIAFVGFFAWGHHMFVSGQSTFNAGVFAVLTMLVGVFTAIKVFNWVGTVYKGAVDFKTPFAYFCGFLYFTVFGGMTGVAFATASLDVPWHDTYFVVAHFHFIMVGATIMAFMAAIHYWFPKMFGKMYHEGWGLVSAALIILGFNATFIPQFLLGNAGMPRRYYEYPERFQTLNVASTAGASLLALGFIVSAIYLVYALVYGEKAAANPWNSKGYEWLTESPPPTHNFVGPQPIYTEEPHFYVDPQKAEEPHAV
ncbi:cbb3-type cytochrome c oxidase subunit I [Melittangium boletus]|uniref:Cytochrome c oxidase subunit I n=1 Tax=Melittangium boletus DSM 14713 TaxID=1294270 RepID=A0A250I9J4_9BACT|nr:cbb3-type cytochrome c oxidase subunit I [Melittangium boletus]ATB28415.1 cytochrome c oxidase subunit I [Melittangium boletus DSM 14713]